MDSARSSDPTGHPTPTPAKILITGGHAAGVTTFVRAAAADPITVSLGATPRLGRWRDHPAIIDVGRITINATLLLFLVSLPDQHRHWRAWDDLARGAIGAVVLADTRRLQGCFAAIDYLEERGIPFLVAANHFDGAPVHPRSGIRNALAVKRDTPVVCCDARCPGSAIEVLVELVRPAKTRMAAATRRGGGGPHPFTLGVLSSRSHLSARPGG